jgi:hypothetical protein
MVDGSEVAVRELEDGFMGVGVEGIVLGAGDGASVEDVVAGLVARERS